MLNFSSSYIIGNMDLHCMRIRSMRLKRAKKDGDGLETLVNFDPEHNSMKFAT